MQKALKMRAFAVRTGLEYFNYINVYVILGSY